MDDKISECCQAPIIRQDVCSDCKEHCNAVEVSE